MTTYDTEKNTAGTPDNYVLLQLNAIVSQMFLNEELSKEQVEFLNKEHPRFEQFLEQPVGSEEDLKAKKMMARVLLIAKERGYLPNEIQSTLPVKQSSETEEQKAERIEQTAAIVANTTEKAVDEVKEKYQVGKEIITPEEAAENAIDKATVAVTNFVADKIIDKGIDKVVNFGVKWVSTTFPPLAPVAIFAGKIIKQFKAPIRKVVKKGIEIVAKTAKKVVKGIVNVGRKVVGWFKSLFA